MNGTEGYIGWEIKDRRCWASSIRSGIAAISVALVIALALIAAPSARAQSDGGLPRTTIEPIEGEGTMPLPSGDEGTPPISEPATTRTPAPFHHHTAVHRAKHTRSASASRERFDVEPANAKLLLKSDAWAFERPAKSSRTVERVHAGKYINVTGSTRYYLRVKLKSGKVAYVPQSAVQLVKPTDKIFHLTSNAAVTAEPNRGAKKIAEVHRGHDIHVIGVSLNYVKIKMRNGLEGYVPMTAVQ